MRAGWPGRIASWLQARRAALAYVAVVFALLFLVYGLYGYPWGVAGYAALLAAAAGLVFAVWDLARFAAKHEALKVLPGGFPTGALPAAANQLEQDYTDIIVALEAERARLARDAQTAQRDAEEYYTLWAHQIKTPMAAMDLLVQTAGESLPEEDRANLSQELFRMGQYVEMVLQYQRLTSLQNDLVLREVSLGTLAKQAARACAPLFIYKKIALDIAEMPKRVVTDEKWFCFVLEQLYANAVKYTAKGAVRVYMPDDATLAVEDTGRGIPPEDLPRVFERGFTGAAGRSERSSTGIGLYLCREVLLRLGFAIEIQSEQGRGTRVLLHLRQNRLELD